MFAGPLDAFTSPDILQRIQQINDLGSYMGLVVPNSKTLEPFLRSPTFQPAEHTPASLDIAGRRFHIGMISGHRVIVVMTGYGMINSAVTTELLLNYFRVRGVIHYGTAGNGNPSHHIGDITIPRKWAHTGLWNWQRFGDGEEDELVGEENGDYTRKIGHLRFAAYNSPTKERSENKLNNLWYQPNEIFPVNDIPEVRQHAFWVPADEGYYQIAESMKDVELESCVNSTTCLTHKPRIVRVERGCSANVYVDNAHYRDFLHNKFKVTPIDMESAGVALVCLSQNARFIAMRALGDLAGGSEEANEAPIFSELSSQNAVTAVTQFLKRLPAPRIQLFRYEE